MQPKHLQATARKGSFGMFRAMNLIPIFLLTLVIAIMIWLWGRIDDPAAYPIEHVKILTSGQYVPEAEIKNTIIHNVHGGFFSLNVRDLKGSLLENPWIQNVSIRRVWPDSLSVQIIEQQPVARFGAAGVLSSQGDVFYPKADTIPGQLPEMDAPLSVKDSVISFYAQMNQLLQPLNVHISKLVVTNRLAWTVLLSNGIEVNLCHDALLERFNSFIRLYPKLIAGSAQNVVSVNLCYPNGLAIQWKDGAAPRI